MSRAGSGALATELDHYFMLHALGLAERAAEYGEVPVGAVLVQENQIIAEGWNQPIRTCDATAHAEIMALREGGQRQGNYRLPDTTLYVTIEPCTMCVGAIIHARVSRVVFGATEPKGGALVSQLQLLEQPHWNHRLQFEGGIEAERASALMQAFFKMRRQKVKQIKQMTQAND